MAITYGGITLRALSGPLAGLIDADISPRDVDPAAVPDWPGPRAPSWWPFPPRTNLRPIKLNSLWWPRDAQHHAVGYFLASDKQLAALRPLAYGAAGAARNALPLVLGDGRAGASVTTRLYMLPPRPLAQCYDFAATASGTQMRGLTNGLYLLQLVDERYYWHERALDFTVTAGTTTWTQLFDAIADALEIALAVDTIPAAYLGPPAELTSHFESVPRLLDAACQCVGHRFVRGLNGSCQTQGSTAAKAAQDRQLTRWRRRKGGLFDPGDLRGEVPATVFVAFPASRDGVEDGTYYPVSTAVAGGHAGTRTFHDANRALFAAGEIANLSDLTALAARHTADFAAWVRGARQDQKYLGIVPYVPEGMSESIEWVLREGEVSTRVQRGNWFERVSADVCCCPVKSRWVKPTAEKTSETQTITSTASGGTWKFAGSKEVQEITTKATGGTWKITGNTTAIPWDAPATLVEGIVRAVTGAMVAVTGSDGGPYTVEWPADGTQSLLGVDGADLTGLSASVAVVEEEAGLAGSATTLAWNASATTVQALARTVTGALVTVAGPNGGPWVITWPDAAPHGLLDLDGSGLTGGSIANVETAPGTNGRYTGITGTSDEDENPGAIDDDVDSIWIREVNDGTLTAGKWYPGEYAGPAPDGLPVYEVGLTPSVFSGARLYNHLISTYTDDGTGPIFTLIFHGPNAGPMFDTDNYAGPTADYLTVPEDGYYLIGCDMVQCQWVPMGGDASGEQGWQVELFGTATPILGVPQTGCGDMLPNITNDGHLITGGPYFTDRSCSSLFKCSKGDSFYLQLNLQLGNFGTWAPEFMYFWIEKVGGLQQKTVGAVTIGASSIVGGTAGNFLKVSTGPVLDQVAPATPASTDGSVVTGLVLQEAIASRADYSQGGF